MLLLLNWNSEAVLRVEILRNGRVQEFANALVQVENVFNHIYALDLIIDHAKEEAGDSESERGVKPVRSLRTIKNPADVVLLEDRLRLYRIRVTSPGWIDVIGKLNPLEAIRQMLNDRHEHKKDDKYRNSAERTKLSLENEKRALEVEKLKTKVVEERVNLLKKLKVPEDKIRQAAMEHFFRPVEALEKLQDKDLIGGARLLSSIDAEGNVD